MSADTASVVICAYTMRRWKALAEAVTSVRRQTRPAGQTILVIDHNETLLARAREALDGVTVVPNVEARGLSGARNTGVRIANGEYVAFLDDDARAHPNWLSELLAGYSDPRVVGTGGLVEPRWVSSKPARWLPSEFHWTIGCSYTGLPASSSPIRNPIGANMSFRRDAIVRAGGFRVGVGRVGTIPLGCEETEMAVRVARALPESRILHVPSARVEHLVEAERACWRYFLARCWAEGRSKAVVARHVGGRAGLASERVYVMRTLPRGIASGVRDALRGDPAGLGRAAAIVLGLSATIAGYARGVLARSQGASAGWAR